MKMMKKLKVFSDGTCYDGIRKNAGPYRNEACGVFQWKGT
jgi:hypothetical protein